MLPSNIVMMVLTCFQTQHADDAIRDYTGCWAAKLRTKFTVDGQSAGQCYQEIDPNGEEHAIFPQTCSTCSCSGIIWGGEPVKPVFKFNEIGTNRETQDAIMASVQPQGRTWTSLAMKQMREDVFVSEAGCRREDIDVRQVLVVITDGNANPGKMHTSPSL